MQANEIGSGQEFATPGTRERKSGSHREWSGDGGAARRAPFLRPGSGSHGQDRIFFSEMRTGVAGRKQETVALVLSLTRTVFPSPLWIRGFGVSTPTSEQWESEG